MDKMQVLFAQRATIIIDQFYLTNQGLFWLFYNKKNALPYKIPSSIIEWLILPKLIY